MLPLIRPRAVRSAGRAADCSDVDAIVDRSGQDPHALKTVPGRASVSRPSLRIGTPATQTCSTPRLDRSADLHPPEGRRPARATLRRRWTDRRPRVCQQGQGGSVRGRSARIDPQGSPSGARRRVSSVIASRSRTQTTDQVGGVTRVAQLTGVRSGVRERGHGASWWSRAVISCSSSLRSTSRNRVARSSSSAVEHHVERMTVATLRDPPNRLPALDEVPMGIGLGDRRSGPSGGPLVVGLGSSPPRQVVSRYCCARSVDGQPQHLGERGHIPNAVGLRIEVLGDDRTTAIWARELGCAPGRPQALDGLTPMPTSATARSR